MQLADLVADLADARVDGRPVLEDTATLRRLGEIAVRIKYLELLCKRSISATLHGGDALGSASLAKSVWAELGQDLAALAFDVLGPPGPADGGSDYRLSSRSLTIAGGTTQINKGITRTRVLGLPRKMNLELTDEQVALRDTVRRFLAEKASVAAHVRPLLDDPTGTTDDGVARAGEPRAPPGVLVPQEYGGAGMTMVEAGIVAEELGAALHPGPWLSSAVAAARALTRIGADATPRCCCRDRRRFHGRHRRPADAARGPSADDATSCAARSTALPDAAAADVLLVLADGRRRHRAVSPSTRRRPASP